MDIQNLQVINNLSEGQFEARLGEDAAGFIAYRMQRDNVYVMLHTEVRAEYEGQGVAHKLVHDALELVKAEGSRIVPLCPYVQSYLRRHPEYEELVVPLRA